MSIHLLSDNSRQFAQRWASCAIGILLCFGIALSATSLSRLLGVPAMLLAIMLGFCVNLVASKLTRIGAAGIDMSAKTLLRLGVALLGLRVALPDILMLGPTTLLIVGASVLVTSFGGYAIARTLRLDPSSSVISAVSVAICGASAALAASSIVRRREDTEGLTIATVLTVSILSTIVMLLYPAISTALHFDALRTSILLGAAIHDVAQVVGAGFSISPEVGVNAVTIKLIRVASLLPILFLFSTLFQNAAKTSHTPTAGATAPWFLIGFFVLAALSSIQMAPETAVRFGIETSSLLLTMAVTAIGIKTSFSALRTTPLSLLLALCLQTTVQFLTVLTLLLLLS